MTNHTDKPTMEQPMRWRKKPVEVEARQVTAAWFDDPHPNPLHIADKAIVVSPRGRFVFVQTAQGTVRADEGDWIVWQVIDGLADYWPVRSDIFAVTYEPVVEQETTPMETYEQTERYHLEEICTDPTVRACVCFEHGWNAGRDALSAPQPTPSPSDQQLREEIAKIRYLCAAKDAEGTYDAADRFFRTIIREHNELREEDGSDLSALRECAKALLLVFDGRYLLDSLASDLQEAIDRLRVLIEGESK